MISVTVEQLADRRFPLKAGDNILLSGIIYTARDAAHKRIVQLIEEDKPLPFTLSDSVIYYAGPTKTPVGMTIGSCGPTTSGRLDPYSPLLYSMGVAATIGKGRRSQGVVDSIAHSKALYLCAFGGCGALSARCVKECEIIAFEELGCEAIRRLKIKNLPLIVGVDRRGNNVFSGR